MVAHSALTGANLHEPKGASGASTNQTYVSDGAGSGAWSEPEPKGVIGADDLNVYLTDGSNSGTMIPWPTGWEFIKDDASGQTINSTPSLLSINGGDASSEDSYLPPVIRGTGNLWNTTTDRITPIAEGDSYEIRVDLPITGETGSPNEITLEFDIAGGVYGSAISIVTRYINTGRSTPYNVTVGFPLFVGSTFLSNGCQIWMYTDTGSATVTAPGITLVRTSAGTI